MSTTCAIQANPDLYGFGIRLGFYLSWIASQVALVLNLEESILEIHDASIVLGSAVAVAVLFLTNTTPAQAHSIEIMIMLYLYMGNAFCNNSSIGFSRWSLECNTGWRAFISMSSTLGMTIYSLWFWTHGSVSDAFLENDLACRPVVFLFAKVPPHHFRSARTTFIVLSALVLAFLLLVACSILKNAVLYPQSRGWKNLARSTFSNLWSRQREVLAQRQKIERISYFRSHKIEQDTSMTEVERMKANYELGKQERLNPDSLTLDAADAAKADGLWVKHLRNQTLIRVVTNLCIAAFFATGIELMLLWNDIDDVYSLGSVGQLIPFVVGIIGFVKVFADGAQRTKEEMQQDTELEVISQLATTFDGGVTFSEALLTGLGSLAGSRVNYWRRHASKKWSEDVPARAQVQNT